MFLVDKYTFNQSKIQMLHSDWLNSNFWITVLYFILTYMHACYAGKNVMILWSSQILRNATQFFFCIFLLFERSD